MQAGLFVIITYVKNYVALIVLFVLFGITSTLFSGAENAWVVDWLIQNKEKRLQKTYFRKRSVIMNAGQLTAAGVGILVVKYLPFEYIWAVSGIGLFIGGIVLLFAKEDFTPKKTKVLVVYKELISSTKEAVTYTFTHKNLKDFTLFLSAIYGVSAFAMMSWDVVLMDTGFPIPFFGLTLVLSSILGILISLYYHNITDKYGHLISLYFGGIILSGFYILSYFVYQPYLFLILLAFQFAIWNSFYYPVSFDYLHNQYKSKMRATLESITNLVSMAVMGVFLVVGGMLNDFYGPRIMILVTGILLGIVFIWYSVIHRTTNKRSLNNP